MVLVQGNLLVRRKIPTAADARDLNAVSQILVRKVGLLGQSVNLTQQLEEVPSVEIRTYVPLTSITIVISSACHCSYWSDVLLDVLLI